jgi:hypothetical protein
VNGAASAVADFNGDGRPDVAALTTDQLIWLFNGAGPNFSISVGTGTSVTVTAGKTATYALSLAGSGGFNRSVALTCSGAPAGATCTISPSSVTLSGTSPKTATVSITTTAASQLSPFTSPKQVGPTGTRLWILGLFLAACIAISFSLVRTPRRCFASSLAATCGAVVLIGAVLIAGCGGSTSNSGSNPGGGSATSSTPSGSYTITVTGTAQSPVVTQTKKLTLVVQ